MKRFIKSELSFTVCGRFNHDGRKYCYGVDSLGVFYDRVNMESLESRS